MRDVVGRLSDIGLCDKKVHPIGVVGDQGSHPNAKAATNQDVRVDDQAFALHRQG